MFEIVYDCIKDQQMFKSKDLKLIEVKSIALP